jgi:hypothetical protein
MVWSQSYDCVDESTSRFSSKDEPMVVKKDLLSPCDRSDRFGCHQFGDRLYQHLVECGELQAQQTFSPRLSSSWRLETLLSIGRYEVLNEGR